MGLSGRKVKQRIAADPRNLTWADDAAKFGSSYLSKLGWDPSKGLGVEGDGRTSHIKVAQKLNLLGIGAGAKQNDKESIAWKQNRDYEILLKRLNEATEDEPEESTGNTIIVSDAKEVAPESSGKKDKKRKRSKSEKDSEQKKESKKSKKGEDAETEDGEMKKKKKSKDKKERKSKAKTESEADRADETIQQPVGQSSELSTLTSSQDSAPNASTSTLPLELEQSTIVARPRAHRARFLKSKQLASRSSSAVAEILGISASNSVTTSYFPTPSASDAARPAPQTDQELTTATQSVGDYFKAKLAARKNVGRSGLSTPVDMNSSTKQPVDVAVAVPTAVAESSHRRSRSVEELPAARVGLGAASRLGFGSGAFVDSGSASVVSSTVLSSPDKGLDSIFVTDAAATIGSGKLRFGGLMGGAPVVSSSLTPVAENADRSPSGADAERGENGAYDTAYGATEKKEKKQKKKKTRNDDPPKGADYPEEGGQRRKKKRRKDSS